MSLKHGPCTFQSKLALCAVSAGALSAAFWWPVGCGWLVFFFLIPLVACVQESSFFLGMVWGMLFFGLHYYGLLCVVIERGSGSLRGFLFVLFVLYSAVHSGAWLWITGVLARLHISCAWQGCVLVLTSWCYFFVIRFYLLWGFGACDGYPFALPLLPLAAHPQWLVTLPMLTSYGLMTCLLVVAITLGHILLCRAWWLFLFTLIAFAPFSYGWLVQEGRIELPVYVDKLAYVAPSRAENPLQCAQETCYALQELFERSPQVRIILMPESSFPWSLNHHLWVVNLWCDSGLLSADRKICIGAYREEGGKTYNSMFYIKDSRIIKYYDKIKPMLFTEYVTPFLQQLLCVKQLFLKNEKGFSATKSVRGELMLADSCPVQPRICSDLFFDAPLCTMPKNASFLVLVNDSWFSASYMRDLMLFFARFVALERQRNIIYVGHYSGFWITQNGWLKPL